MRLDVFFILVVGEGKNVQQHCHIGTFFFLHYEMNVAKKLQSCYWSDNSAGLYL